MYCANCGVKLADSEDRCPLCHTPAYHPDIPRQPGRPLFPSERYPDTAKKTLWLSAFLTLTTVFVAAIVLLCDLQMGNGISWSGYVLGGLATFYVALVLPSWFARPNAVIFVPCTFVTIAAYLFYINLAVGGSWFFSFALPITGIVAAIVTTVITLLRYVRRGRLYIFGGAIMAVAVLSVVLEILMDITFCGYTFLGWCAYPAATFLTIGGLLIFLGICRPAREAMERKFFI
jgi:hypothetical protein